MKCTTRVTSSTALANSSGALEMECVGAIDQGTQSTRFTLFDKDTNVVATSQTALTQIYPKPGWCEHDPVEIMETVRRCIEETHKRARETVGEVKVVALGITNQRETTIVWDRSTGEPLHNAIVWLDGRTSDICHELTKQHGSKDPYRRATGLPISTYFSAVKLLWLMRNVPSIKKAIVEGTCCFGTVDSWIIYNLTNKEVHVTDVTNASRTMLLNLETEQWHRPILEEFEINEGILPKLCSNCEVYGYVQSGSLAGVPIAGSLGDQHAALLGHRCQAGEAKNTYGTGCFLLLNTGNQQMPSTHGLITGIGYKLGPEAPTQYMLEGSVAIAGSIFSWLRDNLGLISSIDEVEVLGKTVKDTGGVSFVPAFGGLLAPHWRDDARGVIVGLTGFTTKAHIVRAAMEAICFQTCEVLEAMKLDASFDALKALKVDGGASRNATLMQIQADILQTVVERPQNQEATSLGAALAAGIAIGVYDDNKNPDTGGTVTRFCPSICADEAEHRYSKWKKAVEKSLDLSDLTS